MASIRSKHNNLLNYFIFDRGKLSKEYLKSCEDFLKNEIKNNKPKTKKHNPELYRVDNLTLNFIKNKKGRI